MTISNTTEARSQIYERIRDAWVAQGQNRQLIHYQDRPTSNQFPPKNPTAAWMRARVEHLTGTQATLQNAVGSRRFRRFGRLVAQVMAPLGTSMQEPDRLGKAILDAVEGVETVGGIYFFNVTMNEIGSDGHWFQTNIFADFRYDEVK